jgi:hypothetical protein
MPPIDLVASSTKTARLLSIAWEEYAVRGGQRNPVSLERYISNRRTGLPEAESQRERCD